MPGDILACAAAELLQPYDAAKPGACSRDSPVGLIHMRLLDLVSHASVMHVFTSRSTMCRQHPALY